MARHRAGPGPATRPRYSRIAAAGLSVLVTLVAVLGAVGVIPTGHNPEPAHASGVREGAVSSEGSLAAAVNPLALRPLEPRQATVTTPAVPEDSGEGRRVVFDMTAQRVWLVSDDEQVRRTYLVSGSLTDNLDAGTYEVFSKSLDAVGIDDSGTMRYMVRFAHGERAAIGFHDIPVRRGEKAQTRAELGTPQSHGCIRQWRPDARALWRFAPVGTKVVVVT